MTEWRKGMVDKGAQTGVQGRDRKVIKEGKE